MQPHRFYLPPENARGDVLRLEGREAHHALHVLRLKRGDPAIVLDGVGTEFTCEVDSTSRDTLALRVAKKRSAPARPCSTTLLVGVPKGKIIDSIIQKSVELGASRLIPLLTDRVVTRLDEDETAEKRDKWQQAAIEAVKQCGALWLPKIEAPVTIGTFLERRESFDLALVGSLQKERRHPREVFEAFQASHNRPPQTVAIWIGPEGDFTPEELKMVQAAGAQPITLGDLTLRVETAAIYCLSVVAYELNP